MAKSEKPHQSHGKGWDTISPLSSLPGWWPTIRKELKTLSFCVRSEGFVPHHGHPHLQDICLTWGERPSSFPLVLSLGEGMSGVAGLTSPMCNVRINKVQWRWQHSQELTRGRVLVISFKPADWVHVRDFLYAWANMFLLLFRQLKLYLLSLAIKMSWQVQVVSSSVSLAIAKTDNAIQSTGCQHKVQSSETERQKFLQCHLWLLTRCTQQPGKVGNVPFAQMPREVA